MNTEKKATEGIKSFLRSDKRFLFLSGTHQFAKHVMALRIVLRWCPSLGTVLFRINTRRNADHFLSPLRIKPSSKPGAHVIVNGCALYVDTINRRSWRSSPRTVNVAVVYPADSLDADEGSTCLDDLVRRGAKKIIIVSCTDNRDFSWVNVRQPVCVEYDAEEERPDYHKRMEEIEQSTAERGASTRLPNYAKGVPSEYLVNVFCGTCRSWRWARLNKPNPGKAALRNAESGAYIAKCLKCGSEQDPT